MRHVNLFHPTMSSLFDQADTYEKTVVVRATLVTEPRQVATILNGTFLETTVTAQVGQYVITNPGGEEYVLDAEKVRLRYEHISDDLYKARGKIKAIRNPFNDHVEILAPWGEPQFGEPSCFFAAALEGDGTDRYIIEEEAFFVTYTKTNS